MAFGTFVGNSLVVALRVYFWDLCSGPLACMAVVRPVPRCFGYCGSSMRRNWDVSASLLLLKNALAIVSLLYVPIHFRMVFLVMCRIELGFWWILCWICRYHWVVWYFYSILPVLKWEYFFLFVCTSYTVFAIFIVEVLHILGSVFLKKKFLEIFHCERKCFCDFSANSLACKKATDYVDFVFGTLMNFFLSSSLLVESIGICTYRSVSCAK